jgi:hypothetical protein
METILQGYERFLAESAPTDSFYEAALSKHESQKHEVPASVQIEDISEELQQLKVLFIEVAAKEHFLLKLAESSSSPFLSMQELVAAEMEADQEKATLKVAKTARAESLEKLEAVCQEITTCVEENMRSHETFSKTVDDGLTSLRVQRVTKLLEQKRTDDLEALAAEAESLDAKSCELILTQMFDELNEAKTEQAKFEANLTALREQAASLKEEQRMLDARVSELNEILEKTEKEDGEAKELRIESTRHRALYNALSSLARMSVSSIEDGRLCLEVVVNRTFGDEKSGYSTNDVTYKFDFALADQFDGMVTSLILTPPDIDVSAMFSTCSPLTVRQATQEAIAALLATPSTNR